MKHLIATILIVLTVGGIALGQEKPAKPAEKTIPDICKGVIDPYDISGEKTLFYAAAGVDNELTSAEFTAAKGKENTFARKFDSWSTLITFDSGKKNGTIDWTEAGEYRQATRRKVMGSFDANKDGSLKGAERMAANKALAAGRLSLSSRSAARDARRAKWRADMLTKYDTDKDGKLSKTEEDTRNKAYAKAREERIEKYRKARELRAHDSNKDGKLDDKESAAATAERADRDKRKKEFMTKYDTNGDGRLSGDEWKEAGPALREAMQKRVIAQYDKNGDGELDEGEKATMQKARDKRRQDGRKRYELQRYDKNKNGTIDKGEAVVRDKARAERQKRYITAHKEFDKDGDGKLNEEEEKAHRAKHGNRGRGGRGRGGRGGGGDR